MLIFSLKRPRPMSIVPTFAELVVYYLPAEEQKNGTTLNTNPNCPPSSKTSVLDMYHYRLLSENEDCNQEVLKSAWKEWRRLGMYEHGEAYRRNILETTRHFGVHVEL